MKGLLQFKFIIMSVIKKTLSAIFASLFSIMLLSQEVTSENFQDYQSYWPYEVTILEIQKWDNGLVVPEQSRAVLLGANENHIIVSAEENRAMGYRSFPIAIERTDALVRINENVENHTKDRMFRALENKVFCLDGDEIRPFSPEKLGKYEYFLIFHISNSCSRSKQRMPEYKRFVETIDTSRVLPIMVSADNAAHEFYMFLLDHQIDWPFIKFEYKGYKSPLLYEQYIANGKGSLPQFVFVDKAGIVYTTFNNHRGKSYEIIQNKLAAP
jgi:hypothetical protein